MYKSIYSNSWALIIGINKYINVPPLDYAYNDAESIAKTLIEKFNFPEQNITLLLDKDANKDNIMRSLLRFANSDIKQDDRILFFFAGHGSTIKGRRGEVGYLVPVNGELNDLSTLIRWDELTRNSEIILAKHVFFIMDACYGGLAITRALQTGSSRFLKSMLQRYSRQVLTAGKADETVADSGGPLPGHSIFTSHLLNALNGNAASSEGIITANNIMSYVYDKVSKDSYSNQTPHFGFLEGDGDFIFDAPRLYSNNEETTEDNDILIEVDSVIENTHIPINTNLIEEVKEYISDDRYRIKLEDRVNQEIRELFTRINEENFPLTVDVNTNLVVQRLKRYESIFYNLNGIMISLGHWGKQNHYPLMNNILTRISENIHSKNGKTTWLKLQWYPSMLLLYYGGISSIAADNYNNLATLFNAKIESSFYDDREDMVLIMGHVLSDLGQTNVFKNLPEHERYHVPISEYLFKVLQPILDDLLFLGKSYEIFFDRFEVFLALVCADYRNEKGMRIWGPVGRFGWKYERYNIINEIYKEAVSKQANWLPFKAGLFGSDFNRFEKICNEYGKYISGLNWF